MLTFTHKHVLGGIRGGDLAHVDDLRLALPCADEHEAAAADAARHRIHHPLAQRRGHRTVNSVPSALQHTGACKDGSTS